MGVLIQIRLYIWFRSLYVIILLHLLIWIKTWNVLNSNLTNFLSIFMHNIKYIYKSFTYLPHHEILRLSFFISHHNNENDYFDDNHIFKCLSKVLENHFQITYFHIYLLHINTSLTYNKIILSLFLLNYREYEIYCRGGSIMLMFVEFLSFRVKDLDCMVLLEFGNRVGKRRIHFSRITSVELCRSLHTNSEFKCCSSER